MSDTHFSDEPQQELTVSESSSPEFPSIPRWGQIVAGLLLLPFTLLCTAGAVSIFWIPKVQSDPLLQLFAAVIALLCLWTVSLAIRLIFGLKGKWLMSPVALRIAAAVAVGLIIGGFFTGVWVDHPLRSALLSTSYVLVAVRLWRVAAYRSRSVA